MKYHHPLTTLPPDHFDDCPTHENKRAGLVPVTLILACLLLAAGLAWFIAAP